ncbi:MAG: alkaline phosphatase D family protein [Burkholderiales bacterium]
MNNTRRSLLIRSAALSAALALPATRILAQPRFAQNPFSLGVASGYPQPESVVLWTRLAPDPLNGGGMPDANVPVRWEIAADAKFSKIVDRGEGLAMPQLAHAVHVQAKGLAPSHWYWYRFMAGDAVSTVGRTRSAPAADDARGKLSFAVASCQHYEHGFYAAYRDMAGQELDFVMHVGDYIYESSWGKGRVRDHHIPEPYTLADYRNRYAQYKMDPNLQAAHAACPWLVTWDDHEVDNDYANDRSQDLDPVEAFLARRAAAYQAYYEHMPLPPGTFSGGPNMKIYGTHAMGQLARIQLLDMRQYRDYHVCSRPGRGDSFAVTVHSTAQWAQCHLQDSDEYIAAVMLSALQAVTAQPLPPVAVQEVKRWRYAQAEAPEEPLRLLDTGLRLGACGDWTRDGRIEGAFLSALDLAEALQPWL